MTLDGRGLEAYEDAVTRLAREHSIQERWSEEELWGVVASAVVAASSTNDIDGAVSRLLNSLRTATATLVFVPVANVLFEAEPIALKDSIVGRMGEPFLRAIYEAASGRTLPSPQEVARLSAAYQSSVEATPFIAFATWCSGQSMLAVEQAERRLRDLVDLSLLLEPTPGTLGLHSLRGSANRPGLRGVTLHRPALAAALSNAKADRELAAEILVVSGDAVRWHRHWFGSEPLPLDRLLAEPHRRADLEFALEGRSPIARRIVVAGRWYAEAHWATDSEDAVLALGIALDALIGARSGLPGRAMRERFALLEPDVTKRQNRAHRYAEIFSVRSAVAHGGSSRRLREATFVRAVAMDVVWATQRMLAFNQLVSPRSEQEVDEAFEQLRWGTRSWS